MRPGAGEYQVLGQLTTGCRGAGCLVVQSNCGVIDSSDGGMQPFNQLGWQGDGGG